MSKGWICLHRALLEWEWYEDMNTTRLFIHCLLKANHRANKWQGIDVPRGSFVTGRKALSKETGLSEQQIRTCLKRLISTNEITTRSTNKNTLLTIVKYSDYQDESEKSTNKKTINPTNEQPATNQQSTTNNNDNNDNNDNKSNWRKRQPEDLDCSLIDGLNIQAYELWVENRRIRKLPKYKTLATAKKLAQFSLSAQMAAVQESIDNEYTGVFPKEIKTKISRIEGRRQATISEFVNGGSVVSEQ